MSSKITVIWEKSSQILQSPPHKEYLLDRQESFLTGWQMDVDTDHTAFSLRSLVTVNLFLFLTGKTTASASAAELSCTRGAKKAHMAINTNPDEAVCCADRLRWTAAFFEVAQLDIWECSKKMTSTSVKMVKPGSGILLLITENICLQKAGHNRVHCQQSYQCVKEQTNSIVMWLIIHIRIGLCSKWKLEIFFF